MPPGTGPLTMADLDAYFSNLVHLDKPEIRVPSNGNYSGTDLPMACIRADTEHDTVFCHFCKDPYQHINNVNLVELIKSHLISCAKFLVLYHNDMVIDFLESIHGTADKLYPIVVDPTMVIDDDVVEILPPPMSTTSNSSMVSTSSQAAAPLVAVTPFSASTSTLGVGSFTTLTTVPEHLCRNLHFGSPGVCLYYNPTTKRAVLSATPPTAAQTEAFAGQFIELCSDIADLTVTAYHKMMPLKRHTQLSDSEKVNQPPNPPSKRQNVGPPKTAAVEQAPSPAKFKPSSPLSASSLFKAAAAAPETLSWRSFLAKYAKAQTTKKAAASKQSNGVGTASLSIAFCTPTPEKSLPNQKDQLQLSDFIAAVDPNLAGSAYLKKKAIVELADRQRVAPQLKTILDRHPPTDSVRSDFSILQEKVNDGEVLTQEQCYTFYAHKAVHAPGPVAMFAICRLCISHVMAFRTGTGASHRNLNLRTHLRSLEHKKLFAQYQSQPRRFQLFTPNSTFDDLLVAYLKLRSAFARRWMEKKFGPMLGESAEQVFEELGDKGGPLLRELYLSVAPAIATGGEESNDSKSNGNGSS